MDPRYILESVGLSLLAICSVGAWTLRVAVAAAGRRRSAAAVAAMEAVLFALVFGSVVASLDDPLRVGGYAAGVAVGTLLGIAMEERFSSGQSMVRLVVDGSGGPETDALRGRGWPVTCIGADGVRGRVAMISVAVDDAALPRLHAAIAAEAPGAFRTTERLRDVRPTAFPPGMHQVRGRPSGRT